MPFATQVRCFNSQTILATFFHDANRYYLLDRRYRLPLRTKIAWCETCEDFSEIEDLYSPDEIKTTIAELAQRSDEWESIDARHRDKCKLANRDLPENLTQHEIHEMWKRALKWRADRQSDGRCLKCKSTLGLVAIPVDGTMKHPARTSQWITCTTCHASFAGQPPIELFDANGFRIAGDDSLETDLTAENTG